MRVLGRGVELVVDLVVDAVLLAADDADLDLEDDVGGAGTGRAARAAICRFSSSGTAEPSHMCDWKHGRPPALTRSVDRGEQRADEAVELVLGAVVGVQRDVDGVVLGHLVRVGRERERAGHHVLDRRAGEVLGAAGRHLHDAVAAGLGEALSAAFRVCEDETLMAG